MTIQLKSICNSLEQYKHTGYFKIQINDFRERLDIPKSYRMSEIDKYVFKPIIKELGFYLKISILKKS